MTATQLDPTETRDAIAATADRIAAARRRGEA